MGERRYNIPYVPWRVVVETEDRPCGPGSSCTEQRDYVYIEARIWTSDWDRICAIDTGSLTDEFSDLERRIAEEIVALHNRHVRENDGHPKPLDETWLHDWFEDKEHVDQENAARAAGKQLRNPFQGM